MARVLNVHEGEDGSVLLDVKYVVGRSTERKVPLEAVEDGLNVNSDAVCGASGSQSQSESSSGMREGTQRRTRVRSRINGSSTTSSRERVKIPNEVRRSTRSSRRTKSMGAPGDALKSASSSP